MDEQREPTNDKDPVVETTGTAAAADGVVAAPGEVRADDAPGTGADAEAGAGDVAAAADAGSDASAAAAATSEPGVGEVDVDPAVGDLIDPPDADDEADDLEDEDVADENEDDDLDEDDDEEEEDDDEVDDLDADEGGEAADEESGVTGGGAVRGDAHEDARGDVAANEASPGVDVDPAVGDLIDPPGAGEDDEDGEDAGDPAVEDVEAEPSADEADQGEALATAHGDEEVDSEAVVQPGVPEVDAQLKAIIEALVYASPDPLTVKSITKVLDGESPEAIEAAIEALKQDYARAGGLQMVEVASGYQIVTRPDLHEWVRRLFHERTTQKLSVAALETLAVIAYKQPITAAEIAEVRGVNTSGVLGTLIDRKLVKITGRKQVVGRPFMYATTREFLNRFGLRDLNDLPKVEDMADALGFDPPLLEDAATTAALPFDSEPTAAPDDAAAIAAAEAGIVEDAGPQGGDPAEE